MIYLLLKLSDPSVENECSNYYINRNNNWNMPQICLQLPNWWHMLQNHNDLVPENPKLLHKYQLRRWRLLSTSIHDTDTYYHHKTNTVFTLYTFHRIRMKVFSLHCSTKHSMWWLTTAIESSLSLCNKWADNNVKLFIFSIISITIKFRSSSEKHLVW